MGEENREARKQTPSETLRREISENSYKDLLNLLDILEDVDRKERHRPTYTSYYVNMAASSE